MVNTAYITIANHIMAYGIVSF